MAVAPCTGREPESYGYVSSRLPAPSKTAMEMRVHATVIGGLQSGWKLAESPTEKLALPFCTGS